MNWYSTEHKITSDSTLAEAASLRYRLEAIKGLRVVGKGEGKLWLLIAGTGSLASAPPGSHEMARGFLLFSTMLAVRHELHNQDVWWEECEVRSTDGPRLTPTGVLVKVTHQGHEVFKGEGADE